MDRRELKQSVQTASPAIEVAKLFCRYVSEALAGSEGLGALPEVSVQPYWSIEFYQSQAIVHVGDERWVRLVAAETERRLPPEEFGIVIAARADALIAEFFYLRERILSNGPA